MKILHITCWYPGKKNPNRAIFIKKQIEALGRFAENKILHFEVVRSSTFKIERHSSKDFEQTIFHTPIFIWFLVELVHLFWLYKQLVYRKRHEQFNLINFHIAYPMLSYWKFLRNKIKTPILISEHWSAYKNNFGLKKDLPRIKNIFCQNIPVSAVSNVLIEDIRLFSSCDFKSYIIPNVVDAKIFYPSATKKIRKKAFLMCSFWKAPKMPMLVLETFKRVLQTNSEIELKIIGNGPLKATMEKWIEDQHLQSKIQLLGAKNSEQIAEIMRDSDIFLHPSGYETFSVVCAEAIASGLSVIASDVGAISEVIKDSGIVVENSVDAWSKAINEMLNSSEKSISAKTNQYDYETVGKIYFDTIKTIIDETEG